MSFGIEDVFVLDETPEEALGSAEQKKETSVGSGDERGRAMGLIKSADALALMGRIGEAEYYANEAMAICGEMKFEEGRAAAMIALTKICMKKGRDEEELEEALDSGMDALKLCRKIGFIKGEAVALLTLSGVYTGMEKSPQAIKYAKEALPVFAELGEARSMAVTYEALKSGYLVKSPPDASRAAKQVQKAFAIYEDAKDKPKMGKCMHTLATVEAKGGDYKKASEALTKAKALFAEAGDAYGQAMVMETLMGFYLEADMFVEAVKAGQDRVSIFHDSGDMYNEGYAMVKLGQVLLQNEAHGKAASIAEAALGIFAGISNMDGLKMAKDLLDDAKQEQRVEEIGMALSMAEDYTHIPKTLIVDPGLNRRVSEAYASSMY